MPYLYESHLSGAIYKTDQELDFEDRYCETCGDSDSYLGFFETDEECDAFIEEQNSYYDYDGEIEGKNDSRT
jgi:hypothetical protein